MQQAIKASCNEVLEVMARLPNFRYATSLPNQLVVLGWLTITQDTSQGHAGVMYQ